MTASTAQAGQSVEQLREAPRYLDASRHVILRHVLDPPQFEAVTIADPAAPLGPWIDVVRSGDPAPAPFGSYDFGGRLDEADAIDIDRAGLTFRGVVGNGDYVAFYGALVTDFDPEDPFRVADKVGIFRADLTTNPPTIEAIAVDGELMSSTVDLFPPISPIPSATWSIPPYDEAILDPTQSLPRRTQPLLGWVAPLAINERGWLAFRCNIEFPDESVHGAVFANAVNSGHMLMVAIEKFDQFPLPADVGEIADTRPRTLGPPVINQSGVVSFYSIAESEVPPDTAISGRTGVFVAEPPAMVSQIHTVRALLHGNQGMNPSISAEDVFDVPRSISPISGGNEQFGIVWFDQPAISCAGDVAFRALIDFDDDGPVGALNALIRWTRQGDVLEVVFRQGDSLPPLPDGTPVNPGGQILAHPNSFPIATTFSRPAINGLGEVAVIAQVSPIFTDPPYPEEALLLWTRDNQPVTLARTRSPQFEVFDPAAQQSYQIFSFGNFESAYVDPLQGDIDRYFKGVALNDAGQALVPFLTQRLPAVPGPPPQDQFLGLGNAHAERALEFNAWNVPIDSRLLSLGSSSDGDAALDRYSGEGAYWLIDPVTLIFAGPFGGPFVDDSPFCPDINGMGCVDTADLGLLISTFGCTGEDCIADVNGDGVVNTADLGLVLGFFGQACLGCGCPESGPESLMAGTVEAPSSPFLREFGFEDAESYVEWLRTLDAVALEAHLAECVEFIERSK